MSGLLIKDIYGLKPVLKQYAIIVGGFMIFSIAAGSEALVTYVNVMALILGLSTILYTFTNDKTSNWSRYGLTLPVRRSDVVMTKYIIALLSVVLNAAVIAITSIGVYIAHGGNIWSNMSFGIIVSPIIVLIQCILIPLIFKYGPDRSRMILMAIVAVPTVSFMLLANYMDMNEFLTMIAASGITEFLIKWGVYVIPVILIVMLFISYSISLASFSKQEF